jgi:hypothetical protein
MCRFNKKWPIKKAHNTQEHIKKDNSQDMRDKDATKQNKFN